MLVLGGMGDGGTMVLTLKEMLSARPTRVYDVRTVTCAYMVNV